LKRTPDEIAGLTIVDHNTLAIANDFDIGAFDEQGNDVRAGAKRRLLRIALTSPLPLP
jgi:hypothetical protein